MEGFEHFPEPAELLRAWDKVRYIPGHAHGDDQHPDCEDGVVTSVKPGRVFVIFSGSTPQSCAPTDLKLLHRPARAKWPAKQDMALKVFLEEQGYFNIRFLDDGMVCNRHFLFTTAVIIEPHWEGFERRICYPKESGLAEKMVASMTSINNDPIPGFTAMK